ncbi:MAG TPA: glycosyltransferase family 4 protein [Terriglobales bacterium]|nr:glycosyltransferase family 4 protein [Terriglobales bacterium]
MRRTTSARRGVCIIVENLPVPADRRVWREARTLADDGYQVSVICPKGCGFEKFHETLEGVEVYRHWAWESSGTRLGYLIEYSWALLIEFLLAFRIYVRTPFSILQACNPPDTIFLIALFFKLFGVQFVFDYHDPNPELYALKFPKKRLVYQLVCLAERLTFQAADFVIATSESGREIAVNRGGVSHERVVVVRTCPDLDEFQPQLAQPELKLGRKYMVVYLGVMGPQDGLDLLLESVDYLVHEKCRQDTVFVLIGPGPEVPRLQALVTARGLEPWVKFTGPLYGDELQAYLSTADVGVAPDPSNVFNDKLTMIKILEYMAFGLPVVIFNLAEGRRLAGEAALYARANDPSDFALQIAALLESEPLRRRIGSIGRQRVQERLNWTKEKHKLLLVFQCVQPGSHKKALDSDSHLTGPAHLSDEDCHSLKRRG